MTTTDTEVVQEVQGGGSPPENPPSGTPATAPSPVDQRLEALEKQNAELMSQLRGLQSEKDKQTAKTATQFGDVHKRLDEYDALLKDGLTPQQARREMQINDMLRERSQPAASTEVPTGTRQGTDFTEYVSNLGMDANDPAVLNLLLSDKDDTTKKAELLDLSIQKKKAPQPQVQAQPSAPLPSGGGQSQGDELGRIYAEIEELKKAPIRDYKKIDGLLKKAQEYLPKG